MGHGCRGYGHIHNTYNNAQKMMRIDDGLYLHGSHHFIASSNDVLHVHTPGH